MLRKPAFLLAALVSVPAAAQNLPLSMAPETAVISPGGVNLVDGKYRPEVTDLSIGSEANGGINFTRIGDSTDNNWRISLVRECEKAPGSTPQTPCTITWQLKSRAVSKTYLTNDDVTFHEQGIPSPGITKLTKTQFTTADGTVIQFESGPDGGVATSMTRKDGISYSFAYDGGGVDGARRLRRVKSNTGYELILDYPASGTGNYNEACVFNSAAVTPPAPTDYTCPAGAQSAQYAWSSENRLASVTDPLTKVWSTTTGSDGTRSYRKPGFTAPWLVNTITNPLGVTQQTFVDGRTITYSYENYEPMVPDGAILPRNTERGVGWVVNGTAATGLAWDVNQQSELSPQFISPSPVFVVDPLGRATGVGFWGGVAEPHAMVVSKTLPGGRSETFEYVNTPSGGMNMVKRRAHPKGGSTDPILDTSYTYDCSVTFNCAKPKTVTDPRGAVTNYEYSDIHGLTVKETLPDPDGAGPITIRPEKRYDYAQFPARGGGSVWLLTQISECRTTASCAGTADETVTSFSYPAAASANNLLPVSRTVRAGDSSLIATTSWTYDGSGNKLTENGPLVATADISRWAYDAKRRVTKTMTPDPDGALSGKPLAVVNTFDDAGRLIRIENGTVPNQATDWNIFAATDSEEFTYDALDRKLTARKKSAGTTFALTQFSYDSFGRLECTAVRMNPATFASPPASACTLGTQGSEGSDRITKNTYDLAGQLLKVTEAYGTADQADEATYVYTASGKRDSLTDARGFKSGMVYDGHDRQTRWLFPDKVTPGAVSATDYEEYAYDKNGNRTSLRKRDESTLTFTYDALNRMTVKTVPGRIGLDPAHTRDVFYDYDLQGRQTEARFDSLSGEGLSSAYDPLGRLVSTTMAMDGASRTLTYQYDLRGVRTWVTHPEGTSTYRFTYVSDLIGRLTSLKRGSAVLRSFSYREDGRLSGSGLAGGITGSSTFDYDEIGRLTVLSHSLAGVPEVGWTFAYTNASQLKQAVRDNDAYAWTGAVAASRGHATNGLNQYTAAGPDTFTYDANGNLTTNSSPSYNHSYTYDIENRLVSGNVGGQTVTLRYDPLGRLYEVAGSTSGTTLFLYDGDELVAEYNSAGAMLRRYVHGIGVDDPVVWFEGPGFGTTLRHLLTDRQGSVVAVTNNLGAIIARNTYDEYGIPKSSDPAQLVVGRFAYTGQIWLPELGMYHYKARLYSPTLGRFLQTDPIGYDDQVNLYAYVGNDPANMADPSGLDGACSNTPDACGMYTKDPDRINAQVRAGGVMAGSVAAVGLYGVITAATSALLSRAPTLYALAAELAEGLAPGAGFAGSAGAALGLAKQLSIETQLGQLAAGRGTAIAGAGARSGDAINDISRITATHGGKAQEWQKVVSNSSQFKDGTQVQTHAYRNVKTGEVVEQKLDVKSVGPSSCTGTRLCN